MRRNPLSRRVVHIGKLLGEIVRREEMKAFGLISCSDYQGNKFTPKIHFLNHAILIPHIPDTLMPLR
jgi:hypothetical protein